MSYAETVENLAKAMAAGPKMSDMLANLRGALGAGPGPMAGVSAGGAVPGGVYAWQPMGGASWANPAAHASASVGIPSFLPSWQPNQAPPQYGVTVTTTTGANPQPEAVEEPAATEALTREAVELRDLLARVLLHLDGDQAAEALVQDIRAKLDAPTVAEHPLHLLERWYTLDSRLIVLSFLREHDALVPLLRFVAESLSVRLDNPVLFLRYADRYILARPVRAHLRLRIDAWQPDVAERVAAWRAEVWEAGGMRKRARGLLVIEEGDD